MTMSRKSAEMAALAALAYLSAGWSACVDGGPMAPGEAERENVCADVRTAVDLLLKSEGAARYIMDRNYEASAYQTACAEFATATGIYEDAERGGPLLEPWEYYYNPFIELAEEFHSLANVHFRHRIGSRQECVPGTVWVTEADGRQSLRDDPCATMEAVAVYREDPGYTELREAGSVLLDVGADIAYACTSRSPDPAVVRRAQSRAAALLDEPLLSRAAVECTTEELRDVFAPEAGGLPERVISGADASPLLNPYSDDAGHSARSDAGVAY